VFSQEEISQTFPIQELCKSLIFYVMAYSVSLVIFFTLPVAMPTNENSAIIKQYFVMHQYIVHKRIRQARMGTGKDLSV
jgi:hypothetical protein